MYIRKFYFILTIFVTSILFLSGASLLYLLDVNYKDKTNPVPKGFFSDIMSPFIADSDPINILVLGGDKVAKNTDTMMLVNFTPSTAQVNILSIPRDTHVKVRGSRISKINSAFPVGGADRAVETVSNFLGVKIKYYIFIDTASFREIIDLLDGVDYDVPANMDYDDPIQNLHIHLKKGQQHLNGKQAEQFMRFRHPNHNNKEIAKFYDGSDLKRIEAQQNFIKEVIRQKMNFKYFAKINELISVIFSNVETNITMSDALKLSQNITKLNRDEMKMMTVPGTSDMLDGLWYYIPKKDETTSIVNQYFTSNEGIAPTQTNNEDDEINTNTKKKTSKSYTKNNPSNGSASIKGSKKPTP